MVAYYKSTEVSSMSETCLGKLTGFAINPARDFAPRIFSAIVFGSGALSVYK